MGLGGKLSNTRILPLAIIANHLPEFVHGELEIHILPAIGLHEITLSQPKMDFC